MPTNNASKLVLAIPPILIAQWGIVNPAKSLTQCVISGSDDPTYGSIGWLPPTDGTPFALIKVQGIGQSVPETNRVWMSYHLDTFLGIIHGDTENVIFDYNDQALQWAENYVQIVAANRRLTPASLTVSSTSGDVRWEFTGGAIREKHPIYEIPYYGLVLNTKLTITMAVNYEG